MVRKLKVGDRVKCVYKNSKCYGHIGTIIYRRIDGLIIKWDNVNLNILLLAKWNYDSSFALLRECNVCESLEVCIHQDLVND